MTRKGGERGSSGKSAVAILAPVSGNEAGRRHRASAAAVDTIIRFFDSIRHERRRSVTLAPPAKLFSFLRQCVTDDTIRYDTSA